MQTTLQALFRSTTTGVVVQGFRSSSVPVTHKGYLVESRRPLWFGSSQANHSVFNTLSRHSPLAAMSGVVWCIIVFHSTTFSHLHTLSHNNSLIPRSFPPPTVACKTTGEERLGNRYQMPVFVSNITWVCANHGFIVHTLCHYCEMVATGAGNKVSKHLEAT